MRFDSLHLRMRALCAFLCTMLCAAAGVRAQTAGNLDTGYDPNVSGQAPTSGTLVFGGSTSSVSVIVTQPDGKTIVGGSFTMAGSTPCKGLARLNADGSVDASFTAGLAADSVVSSVALLPNGKMLVASSSPDSTYGTQSVYSFKRLNADGSVDTAYRRTADHVGAIAVQADGKVLIAGSFTSYNSYGWSQYYTAVIRLKTDGTGDPTFVQSSDNASGGIHATYTDGPLAVNGLVIQADGKILLKGTFSNWMGQARAGIARLNADGTLDAGFDPGSTLWNSNLEGSGNITAMALQGDGRILLAGRFTDSNNQNVYKLVRLNVDGSVDGTFSPSSYTNSTYTGLLFALGGDMISLLAVQSNGKILIGGKFGAANGQARTKIARLYADGTLESNASFDAGSGIGGTTGASIFDSTLVIWTLVAVPDMTKPLSFALQADGSIIAGGDFTTVNGQVRNRMARLLNDPASQSLTVVDANHVEWQRGGSAPEVTQAAFQISTDGGVNWSALGIGERVAGGWRVTGASLPASGIVRALAFPAGGSIVAQSQAFSGLPVFTITTSLSPATYNPGFVIAGAPPPATGAITGDGNRAAGSAVTLVATPIAGYDFVNWTENGTPVSSTASYTFTATADRTLVGNLALKSYSITSAASPASAGATRGGGTWNHGTRVSLVASATAGYSFANWTENGIPVSTNASWGFAATASQSLVANFTPNSYYVGATSTPYNGGTVAGGGAFQHGAAVTLVASPDAGYQFDGWSDGGTIMNWARTLNFTAKGNRMLVANFSPVVPLSGGANFTGATIFNGTAGNLYLGSSVSAYIATVGGGGLLLWPGGIPPVIHTIAANVLPAAGGWAVGAGGVYSGGAVTLLATPAPGFTFTNWTENGTVVSTAESYTFTPSADRSVVANFTGNSNAGLASLFSDQASFTQAFDANVMTYSAKVPSKTKAFTVSPALAQDGATIKINGAVASSGGSSPAVLLRVGSNVIAVEVTAPDGVTTKTYTITVERFSLPKDLDGDGNADLIFQNTAGQIGAWYMDANGTPTFSAIIYSGGLGDWKVRQTADMNGDGNADIIFQNSVGQIAVWYMNGKGTADSTAFLYAGGLGDWKIVAAADLNRDGKNDLLFQNTAGQIAVWYMNGHGAVTSSVILYAGGLGDWRVTGAADMDGDGNADFIFQNAAGQIAVWSMSAQGTLVSSALLYAGALGDWKMVSAADMNGDGKNDLTFQNNAGHIFVWRMNGLGAAISSGYIYQGSLGDWRLR